MNFKKLDKYLLYNNYKSLRSSIAIFILGIVGLIYSLSGKNMTVNDLIKLKGNPTNYRYIDESSRSHKTMKKSHQRFLEIQFDNAYWLRVTKIENEKSSQFLNFIDWESSTIEFHITKTDEKDYLAGEPVIPFSFVIDNKHKIIDIDNTLIDSAIKTEELMYISVFAIIGGGLYLSFFYFSTKKYKNVC